MIDQLDEPDRTAQEPGAALYYEIRVDYGHDIDPVSGTYLVVEFGPNDLVSSVRTEDWKLTNKRSLW